MPNRRPGKSHSKKIARFKNEHPEGRKAFAMAKKAARIKKRENILRVGCINKKIAPNYPEKRRWRLVLNRFSFDKTPFSFWLIFTGLQNKRILCYND